MFHASGYNGSYPFSDHDYGNYGPGDSITLTGHVHEDDSGYPRLGYKTMKFYVSGCCPYNWEYLGQATDSDGDGDAVLTYNNLNLAGGPDTYEVKYEFTGDSYYVSDYSYYDTFTYIEPITPYVRNWDNYGGVHNYGSFFGSESVTLYGYAWRDGYQGTPAVGAQMTFQFRYRAWSGDTWDRWYSRTGSLTNSNGRASCSYVFPLAGSPSPRRYEFRALIAEQPGYNYAISTYQDYAKWYGVMGHESTNLTEGSVTVDPFVEVGTVEDKYMWTTTLAGDILDLNITESNLNHYESNQSFSIDSTILLSERIGDQWQIVQLTELPVGLEANKTMEVSNKYSIKYENGSILSRIINHNMTVGDQNRINELGYGTTYLDVQTLLTEWNTFEYETLNTTEKIAFVNQMRHAYNLVQLPYNEAFNSFAQNYTVSNIINEYLDITNSENKIALVISSSEYRNTNIESKDWATVHNYINLTSLLKENDYRVIYLLDEYLKGDNLQHITNLIDSNEDKNSSIFVGYIGHINALEEDVNNATQATAMADAQLIIDTVFNSIISVWESENQIILIDGCHAEGFAYDLQQEGRVIWASSGVAEPDYFDPDIDDKYTVFYHYFINYWNNSLSIEENFTNIRLAIIDDEMIFTPVLFDDDETKDVFL